MLAMIDNRVREFVDLPSVTGPRVGSEQANFVGNGFVHELSHRLARNTFQNADDDVALAADGTDDFDFSGAGPAVPAIALLPMFVLGFSADVSLVNVDNASELVGLVFTEASTNAIAHIEGGFVGAEAHVAHDLEGAHSLFTGQHKVDDLEPVPQRLVRVFEDGADQNGEPITARFGALAALPMEGSIGHGINVNVPAARAMNALGPAAHDEVSLAIIIGREQVIKLLICKLFYGFDAGHIGLPHSMEAT